MTEDTKTYNGTAWVNDEDPMIVVQDGTLAQKEYPGYEFVSMTPEVSEGDSVASGTVITLTYEPRTDLSYTVRYLEKGTNEVLHKEKTVGNKTLGDSVTELAETINGYTPDAQQKSITIVAEGNVITFYYEKIDVTITKTAVDERGREVEPLYEYREEETVYFKISVTNNSRTATIDEYTVTDTLTQELSFKGNQPAGTSVNGNTLTWTINDLRAGETESITITTKVNTDKWQSESNLHDIITPPEAPEGKGKLMTKSEYDNGTFGLWGSGTSARENQYAYNYTDEYCNTSFHVYKSANGEIPHEDGTTHYPVENYIHVGFGRISELSHDETLSSVENLNVVIDQNNKVVVGINYAPVYNGLEDGQIILWYVAKSEEGEETINGETGYVKYHVDGIIVDLTNIYTIRNTATGSDGESAYDEILAKDSSTNLFRTARTIALSYEDESEIDILAEEMKQEQANSLKEETSTDVDKEEAVKEETTTDVDKEEIVKEEETTVEETKPEEEQQTNKEENTVQKEETEEPSQEKTTVEEPKEESNKVEEVLEQAQPGINTKVTEQAAVVNKVETSN